MVRNVKSRRVGYTRSSPTEGIRSSPEQSVSRTQELFSLSKAEKQFLGPSKRSSSRRNHSAVEVFFGRPNQLSGTNRPLKLESGRSHARPLLSLNLRCATEKVPAEQQHPERQNEDGGRLQQVGDVAEVGEVAEEEEEAIKEADDP